MAEADSFVVDFCRVLEVSGCKWICYRRTKKPNSVIIGACDGIDLWQKNITANPTSSAADLTKLRWNVDQLWWKGVVFSVAHTDISRTTRLSSVCVHDVSPDGGGKMAE